MQVCDIILEGAHPPENGLIQVQRFHLGQSGSM